VVGGGGYLLAGLFRVNRSFQTFRKTLENPKIFRKLSAKTTPGRQRGNPRTVGIDSVEARENTHFQEKSKGAIFPFRTAWIWPRPSGRRYLGAPPVPVNHRLRTDEN
jgi:hypothetical protein